MAWMAWPGVDHGAWPRLGRADAMVQLGGNNRAVGCATSSAMIPKMSFSGTYFMKAVVDRLAKSPYLSTKFGVAI